MPKQLFSILAGVTLALTAAPSLAEGANPSGLIEQLALANRLIALGDAHKDPLLLIAAARIQKGIDNQNISVPTVDVSTKSVLDRARQYAGNRKDLIGMADDVAAHKSKAHTLDCAEPHLPPCGKTIFRF